MRYVLIFLFIVSRVLASDNVADYYQKLYKSKVVHLLNNSKTKQNFLNYKIYKKGSYWYAKDTKFKNSKILSIKLKDNYFQIHDENGNGAEIVEVKLFKTNHKSIILLISDSLTDSTGYVEKSKLDCFEYYSMGNRWYKKEFFSKFKLSFYLSSRSSLKDLKVLESIGTTIHYDLSDTKYALNIKLSFPKDVINKVCSGDSSIQVANPQDYKYYCKGIKYMEREKPYIFDSTKGSFIPTLAITNNLKTKNPKTTLSVFEKIKKQREVLWERYSHE